MRKYLFILLLINISLSAFGQKNGEEKRLVIFAGPGMSHVFNGDDFNATFGYTLGVESIVNQLSTKSLLIAGINYSRQGMKYNTIVSAETLPTTTLSTSSTIGVPYSGNLNLHYLNLPIMYRYQSPNGIFMEAGFETGFLLNAKNIPNNKESMDFKEHVKLIDISMPVGVGYWFSNHLSIGVRADFGLTNLSTDETDFMSGSKSYQNFLLSGALRYSF